MVNFVWTTMILTGILWAGLAGNVTDITSAIFRQATRGLISSLEFIAITAVWFGISRVAEKAGLLKGLSRLINPLLRPLFPGIPSGHPALGSITMNLTANLLGLADAATPFGLKAMKQLQEINPRRATVSPAMIIFLALNSAAPTLVPSTAIALRANAGSMEPNSIIIPAVLVSIAATVTVLFAGRLLIRRTFP